MNISAMYPGTFDPITRGHEDLLDRAAVFFDRVVVAIAASPGKTPLFSLEERLELASETFRGRPNVTVTGYDELTVDFARNHGLRAIIRGLRAVSDFEREFQLAATNRQLTEEVETVFLTPTEKFTFVSSSLVREIAQLGGDVSAFVRPYVAAALRRKFGE